MPRNSINTPHSFWNICGKITFKSQQHSFTSLIKKGYELYSECKVGYKEKNWAPFSCHTPHKLFKWFLVHGLCYSNDLVKTKRSCHFCLINILGISSESKHTMLYPNLSSALRTVAHREELPYLTENVILSDSEQIKISQWMIIVI